MIFSPLSPKIIPGKENETQIKTFSGKEKHFALDYVQKNQLNYVKKKKIKC